MSHDAPAPLSTVAEIQRWLTERIAERSGVPPQSIDTSSRFSNCGVDSMAATALLAALGTTLGRRLHPTLMWEYPTVESLARHLAAGPSGSTESSDAPSGHAGKRPYNAPAAEPIAIVGLACRFPKAADRDAFWRLLCDGVDAIGEVPQERWSVDAYYSAEPGAPGKMRTRWGGFLEQVDRFDPQFFDISPREAVQMDPQQRLMLELSWESLEDAGVAPRGLKGSQTGVFFGAMWSDYARGPRGDIEAIAQHTATGQDLSIIAARVSYTLGLQGPSLHVNTACSSSLVAVHLACQSLRLGECDLALAGGVNLIIAPESTVAMSKFGALSPDGRSKAFDARANGYARGEGGGVVVLKPLSRALADGDMIYCLIRGSAVNNDGFSNGLTAPNPKAQEAVLREAYARARVKPEEVDYVEAHGTGTILGDPIEARALSAVLCADRPPERPLRIGSVKTNIGHLEAAAGIAGLIRVALSMRHRELQPTLHFERPNPHIPVDELRLAVQRAAEPWPERAHGEALAGVSSFGFGGTNCHVVLEGVRHDGTLLLPLSAPSAGALSALGARVHALAASSPGERPPLPALCAAAAARLSHEDHRLALSVSSYDELDARLRALGDAGASTRPGASPGVLGGVAGACRPKVAFLFGGQGSQWLRMGRDLLREEPVFRAALLQCDEAMQPHAPFSLLAALTAESPRLLDASDVVQPAIFAIQVALAALWRSWGVEPDAVVGQSLGEVAAAHVAGALCLKDAARIICARGRLVEQASGAGGMALVELSTAEAERALERHERRLWVAGSSSPSATLVSGDAGALTELLDELAGRQVTCRRVRVNYASHCPHMDALCPELERAVQEISPRRGATPFYSTVTGARLEGDALGPAYWARNLREPVLFSTAVERLVEDGHDAFVDVNPHPVLAHAVTVSLARLGRRGLAVPSLRRDEPARAILLDSLGALYTAGAPVAWERLAPSGAGVADALAASLPWLGGPAPEAGSQPQRAQAREATSAELLVLSARAPQALRELATSMASRLRAPGGALLRDVCYTASVRRSHHEHRLSVVAASRDEMAGALEASLGGATRAGVARGEAPPGPRPRLVFVFSGQGSQWPGMGWTLLQEEPVFRGVVEACDALLEAHAGWSLLDALRAPEATSRLQETQVAQAALFAVQVALAELFSSWGITADAVIGHSVGELAAAHVAGALGLEEAVRIVHHRGRLMQRATGLGKMASVQAPVEQAARALEGYEGRLAIAAVNDPGSVVLSGDAQALAEVVEALRRGHVHCRELPVSYAFHSPQMEPFRGELLSALGTVAPRRAARLMVSTVTGEGVGGEELDASYWARNLREPVQLAGAVDHACAAGHRVFVEVGPHPVLSASVQRCLSERGLDGLVTPTLRRGRDGRRCMLEAVGALHAHGYPVDWARLYPTGGRSTSLPAYPWQRKRYWLEAPGDARRREQAGTSSAPPAALLSALSTADAAAFAAQLGLPAAPSADELRLIGRLLDALRAKAAEEREGAEIQPWLHELGWRSAPPASPPAPPSGPGHWVVLVDEGGIGDRLADALEASGATCSRLRLGTAVRRLAEHVWTSDPTPESLGAWWSARAAERGAARGVIHLWSLNGAPREGDALGAALERGVESALALLQAALTTPRQERPRAWFVTRGAVSVGSGDPVTAPAQAPLWGLCRTLSLEHPEVWGGIVDLPPAPDASAVPALLAQVLGADPEDHVALRPSGRFVQRLVRSASGAQAAAKPWSTSGTALVTGGLGALGRRVARWLLQRGARHLVLASRRAASADDRAFVASLEALGASVTVAQADAADAEAMAAVLADIDARLPPLSAVFHLAGVSDHTPLAGLDVARLRRVMAPKVQGTSVLDALTRGRPLDAFVCFSSIAAVWGAARQAAYAAANAFQDALVRARRAAGAAAVSVSFGPWRDGGMATDVLAPLEARGVRALGPEAAIAALSRILGGTAEQVVVADVDWPRFRAVYESSGERPLLSDMPRAPEAATSAVERALLDELTAAPARERRRMLARWLQTEVARTLGFGEPDEVSPTRGFFELGVDSLMAVELCGSLKRAFGLPLSPSVTFNHPNVVAMTDFLLEELSLCEPGGAGATADVEPSPPAAAAEVDEAPLAIVGMACRFPGGADSPDALWELLARGGDAVSEVPAERWDAAAYYDPDPDAAGKTYVREGAFLAETPDRFDARFFGISPREASHIDPQHRLLLEIIWEALEDAGVVPDDEPLTGVFVGIGPSDYALLQRAREGLGALNAYTLSGTFTSFSAGRLSHALGLEGPSMAVDTACSSSLAAIHLACQSLRSGECRVAVAGGVHLMLSPYLYVYLSRLRALSPDGRCKTFSAGADGYGRGEGCGMVVLKRLSDAQREGDRILAVIRGSAVNSDGRSSGITVPSGQAQQAVVRKALASARLSPGDIDYVEAHGTGTALGDPIEIDALAAVFGERRPEGRPLKVGSVKTNIGHLEAAAGVAGLMKVVLALRRGELPAQLHASALSPHIPWAEIPIAVTAAAEAWPRAGRTRRAGVSAFGMSGTNVHVVLEEAPEAAAPPADAEVRLALLPLSARSPAALTALAETYSGLLRGAPAGEGARLADVAYTASVRRRHHERRAAVVGRSREELAEALDAFARGESHPAVAHGQAAPGLPPRVVFVFPGQGQQWAGMGQQLLREEPVFRAALEACEPLVQRHAGFSLLGELAAPEATSRLDRTEVAQPAIFAVQVALAALWRSLGVAPDAVLGHSVGEVAAAHVAGVLTLEEAIRLAVSRGQLAQRVSGLGRMASVALPAAEAESALAGHEDRLSIAAINDSRSVVLSGDVAALEAVVERLQQRQVPCRMLRVHYASHCPQMAPLQHELRRALGDLAPARASVPVYSTVTGARASGEELDAAYWASNLREPVQFARAMSAALDDGHEIFLEVSPHPALLSSLQQCIADRDAAAHALFTLRRDQEEQQSVLQALGALYAHGYPVSWERLYPSGGRCVPLPSYPWQRERYWLEESAAEPEPEARPDASERADELLHAIEWHRSPPAAAAAERSQRGAWLLLLDRAGTGAELAALLEGRGEACVRVVAGERFSRIAARRYEVNPEDRASLLALLDDAFGDEGACRGVVHLWGLDAGAADSAAPDALAAASRLGALSALLLAGAIVRKGWRDAPPLWLVTRGAQAVAEVGPVSVPQAPLWGLGGALSAEHPELRCRRVDLSEAAAAGDAEALLCELDAADHEERVALRSGGRYVARLARSAPAGGAAGGARFQADGGYLIAAGLEGFGLSLARWMVQEGARHLVLTGGEGAAEAARSAIEAMTAAGAEVVVAHADLSQRAQAAEVVAMIEQRFGALCGVVHAAPPAVRPHAAHDARDTHDARDALEPQDPRRSWATMAAAARGAWNLHALTAERPLDLFVLRSSALPLLGAPGDPIAAAGAAFLDALAHHRRSLGLPALCVDWGLLADEAAAPGQDAGAARRASRGIGLLTEADALGALGRLLGGAPAQASALRFDVRQWLESYPRAAGWGFWERLRGERGRPAPRAPGAAHLRAALDGAAPGERPALIERFVREQVARVLRLDPASIERHAPLSGLGLDSLMGLELRNRLEAGLGLALPPTLLWTYPHVAGLSAHLAGKLGPLAGARPEPPSPEEAAAGAAELAAAALAGEPIAVVGLSCRFPGGGDHPDAFWDALKRGVDAIQPIPATRWPADAVPGDLPGARWAGLLDAVDGFDARFFGISPREATSLDPQQRLLLEVAWEALEDAGHPPERLMGSRTGVFVGMAAQDYQHRVAALDVQELDVYCATGTWASTAAGRLSYVFGLEGPSMTVDTACSSSLVALHLACQSLRSGESELALAGGVSLILSPLSMCLVGQTQALAPDGRCRTFDAGASGYVRAEGCGVVVLKRLSDAQRDGDRIWALVRGSAVNQDGRSAGLTAPSVLAQQALVRQALEGAGVAPSRVGYIEAHGTGTSLGDPIELQALVEVLGRPRPDGLPCWLGSVKTNLGHLEAASGVAGFIKAVLSLHHGAIPRHLHFRTLNPRISLEGTPFAIPVAEVPWPPGEAPRIAGVSSFGISGTNAHVVLEEAPRSAGPAPSGEAGVVLLPLSARSPDALSALAEAYRRFLSRLPAEAEPDLGDIAYTASVRRGHHAHRLALTGGSRQELVELLDAYRRGEPRAGLAHGDATLAARPRVVFVFPGQGSQWVGMGRQLLQREPVFRAAMAACDAAIAQETRWSLLEELDAGEERSRLDQIDVVQPVLFAMGVALSALWRSWGVEPDAAVGHSMGEVAAAHVAGALTLEDAARVVCRRSQLMARLSGQGAMALVELPLAPAQQALGPYQGRVSVAASNSPSTTVLSGEPGALEELLSELGERGVFCRRVKVDVASHSPQMDPLLDALERELSGLAPAAARVPLCSTVTGEGCRGDELGAAYWARNLREPVLFSKAVERLSEGGPALFIEMSPHPVLGPAIDEGLRAHGRGGAALASLRREQDEARALRESLGALYARGYPVDFSRQHPSGGRCVPLPSYPWQRERYWIEGSATVAGAWRPLAPLASLAPPDVAEELLHEVAWERSAPAPANDARRRPPRGAWLLLADRRGLGDEVEALLRRRGDACVRAVAGERTARLAEGRYELDPEDPLAFRFLLDDALRGGPALRGVVHLWSLDAAAPEATTAETLERDQHLGTLSALFLAQALLRAGWRDAPRLWLVTRGAQAVSGSSPVSVSQAPLLGFGRVLASEHPELRCTRVDLSPAREPDEAPALLRELDSSDDEDQVALRPSGRHVARLARGALRGTAERAVDLRPDGSYLIVGGLGGLGLALAQWMVSRGARHLVLSGRSGASEPARRAIEAMQAEGAQVVVAQADVSQRAEVAGLLATIERRAPRLRGVVHAAMVLADSTVLEQSPERFWKTMSPKMHGAWHLHELTADRPLDFFVLYSSVASLLGAPGNGNYTAASAFLDALAHHRRSLGLPALSIDWGLFSDAGVVARQSEIMGHVGHRGMDGLTADEGLSALERLLATDLAQVAVVRFNVHQWLEYYPSAARSRYWDRLRKERARLASGVEEIVRIREVLERARPDERRALMERHLTEQLCRVLRMGAADVDALAVFTSLGIDSLMSLELRNRLESGLGLKLPATLLFTYPTIASLAEHLLQKLAMDMDDAPPQGASGPAVAALPDDLDDLAGSALLSLLDEELMLASERKIG
ncbi:SDR family NAD(P)-dependent oxidoreductase [Sorangium sp. So ce429]